MISELVREGRTFLQKGELVRAKDISRQIQQYTDYYIVSEEEWKTVSTYNKEVTLLETITQIRETGGSSLDWFPKLHSSS
jgi:predicted RNA-binding protein with EMAP domain